MTSGVVGRQEPAALGGRRDRFPLAPVHLDEDALELGSLMLAAVDAQRQMLAEAVELPDLDRGAERAGLQVEAQPFILIVGVRLEIADDEQVEGRERDRVQERNASSRL